ncbi:unnamed protein product [Lactuca saligna]|uniref:Uncharacterized protein n=1 Tax=Lactuca saligna TaxID=75948 RepID=A0AA35URW2_LACSI|nr:unnamed protein product [Lactuca saligna]
MPGRYAELDQYCWADEFSQQHGGDPNALALSFERQNGTVGWAFKFQHEQMQMMSVDRMAGANIPSLAAMEQTRMLAHTLAQNTNPKFQNCKFLQFVSKTSHGELTIKDNQVRPAGGDWENEYQQYPMTNNQCVRMCWTKGFSFSTSAYVPGQPSGSGGMFCAD